MRDKTIFLKNYGHIKYILENERLKWDL